MLCKYMYAYFLKIVSDFQYFVIQGFHTEIISNNSFNLLDKA